jgi:hypothetical protein
MNQYCAICVEDDGTLDSHHIFPVAYGGPEDGPQVMLCSSHHRKLHTFSNRVYKGKAKDYSDFFSDIEFKRATPLIQAIVNARIQLEMSGRPVNTIRRLQLDIPQSLYLALHNLKRDKGFTNLQTFIIAVLTAATRSN